MYRKDAQLFVRRRNQNEMKTALEKRRLKHAYLEKLGEGYETGDFSALFSCLSKDCIMESQWVMTPNTGYDAVVEYYTGKGATLQRTKSFPSCSIQELVGNVHPIEKADVHVNGGEAVQSGVGLFYTPCDICLLMEQELKDETVRIIATIQIDDEEKIKRIDLCMPELFQFRPFYTYVNFFPANGENDIADGEIMIPEPYYAELYLFLGIASFDFDEYGDLNIPMPVWIQCVEEWRKFYSYSTFDEAFEKTCGINYAQATIDNDYAKRMLSRNGKVMWLNREKNRIIIDEILEWTEKYKGICKNINTYGF